MKAVVALASLLVSMVPVTGPARGAAQGTDVVAALRQAERVLWVGAHPDDENACGALLAHAADLSGELVLASATRGENSDLLWGGLCRGSDVGRARAELFRDAAERFGAADVEFGPFVNGPHSLQDLDGQCPPGAPFQPWPPQTKWEDVRRKWALDAGADPVEWFVALLRSRRPDVVISLDGHCGVSGHPEHIAVARLLEEAFALAADSQWRPDLGPAHRVNAWIVSALVAPPLRACGLCKCQGSARPETVEDVFALDTSSLHGVTYFRVACRVAKHYENVMLQKGLSRAALEALCAQAEQSALAAWQNGQKGHPIFEPYRVVRW